jgi:hypothetical protein
MGNNEEDDITSQPVTSAVKNGSGLFMIQSKDKLGKKVA